MQRTTTLLVSLRRVIRLYDSMLKPVCDQYGLVPLEVTIISFLTNNPGRGLVITAPPSVSDPVPAVVSSINLPAPKRAVVGSEKVNIAKTS